MNLIAVRNGLIMILMSAVVAAYLVRSEGDLIKTIIIISGFVILLVTLYYERYSFFLMVLLGLLLEQFILNSPIDQTRTYIMGRYYFGNLDKVTPFKFLKANLLEFHLVALLLVLIFKRMFRPDYRWPKMHLFPFAMAFLSVVIFTEAMGIMRGGDFLTSLWEIRALFYLVMVYLISPMMIKDEKDVRLLVWVIIAALTVKAFQGSYYFFILLGGRFDVSQSVLGHEDSHFLNAAFILLLGMFLLKVRDWQKWVLLAICPLMMVAFLANERRVTYGTLGVSLIIAVLMIDDKKLKRRALKLAAAMLILAIPYSIVYWNNKYSRLARPIQQVKSVFNQEDKSNLYRDNEKINLAHTITNDPLGIGFGRKYSIVVPLDDISKFFPLWDVIPHNSILGFWTKAGTQGFIIFLLFFGAAMAQGAHCFRRFQDPYFKALALMVVTQIAGQLIVSYYDLQLNYYRNMIFLGTQLGLLAALSSIAAKQESNVRCKERPNCPRPTSDIGFTFDVGRTDVGRRTLQTSDVGRFDVGRTDVGFAYRHRTSDVLTSDV